MWSYFVGPDQGGHYRWWLRNADGTTMAVSGESFDSAANARRAALNFKEHCAVWRYVIFEAHNQAWYWHARAANNQNVAASGRGYATMVDAQASADAVRVTGVAAEGP